MLNLFDIIMTAITVVMALIPLFNQVIIPKKDVVNKNFFARLKGAGWTMIILSIVLCGMVWTKGIYSDYLKKRNENPDVVLNQSPIFQFERMNSDSIPIAVSVKNVKEGKAINIDAKIFAIEKRGEAYVVTDTKRNQSPSGVSFVKDIPYSYFLNYLIKGANESQKRFIYMVVDYTNESGEKMKPFTILFQVPYPKPGTMIYDLDKNTYHEIASYLNGIGQTDIQP